MREIEIKLRVNNLEELEKKLTSSGCKLSQEIRQEDMVYNHKDDTTDFDGAYEGHVALRLRVEEGMAKFTLKQQQTYEMDNLEYETVVEKPEELKQILLLIGWEANSRSKKV